MPNAFISFVVPCYNIEQYVQRCLDSLARQSLRSEDEIEFVLVNDGSTDGTLNVLEEFASSNRRAILVNQENQGVSAARNNGLKKAHGKYVYFLDGDDFLTDDASQIIYDACQGKEVDIIVTNAYGVREGNMSRKTNWDTCPGLEPGIYSVLQFVESVKTLPISFKTYKKDFLIDNELYYDKDLKVGEVLCFFIHCLAYAKTIAFSEGRIMNYFHRKGSVMRDYNTARDVRIAETLHRLDEYAGLFSFNLRQCDSYVNAIYNIANYFSVFKYLKAPVFNKDIKTFLGKVVKDSVYRDALKRIISSYSLFNRKIINPALLYYTPIGFSFRILRQKNKISSFLKKKRL